MNLNALLLVAVLSAVEEGVNPSPQEDQMYWYSYILRYSSVLVLVGFSGLFSGLTLGLMGLDKIGLEIVIGAGAADNATEDQKIQAEYAKQIQPIRENGNLLLCTLLLGNVAVNTLLSIQMAEMTGGLVGFLTSTIAIVIFGEILPQSVCSRYALYFGSKSVFLVRIIMMLLFVFTWPIAYILDKILGDEIGTIHSSAELMKLLKIHVQHQAVDKEQGQIMIGALGYKDKTVAEVMTLVEDVKMLNVHDKLGFSTISMIFKSGFSRIPVYDRDKNDIVGVVFTKDLIFIDPEDETPVERFHQIFGRSCDKVLPDQKLNETLHTFKNGSGHMLLVHQPKHRPGAGVGSESGDIELTRAGSNRRGRRSATQEARSMGGHDPGDSHSHPHLPSSRKEEDAQEGEASDPSDPSSRSPRAGSPRTGGGSGGEGQDFEIVGVVTLEDIIEEILQDEIVDETDVFIDNETKLRVERQTFDYAMLGLLDSRIVQQQLSAEEVSGIASHLCFNYKHVFCSEMNGRRISVEEVRKLLQKCSVQELHDHDENLRVLYQRDKVDAFCTIVLSGRLEIQSGRDKFISDAGPWSVLAPEALITRRGAYAPDFSAIVRQTVRCIRIDQADFIHCNSTRNDGVFAPRPLVEPDSPWNPNLYGHKTPSSAQQQQPKMSSRHSTWPESQRGRSASSAETYAYRHAKIRQQQQQHAQSEMHFKPFDQQLAGRLNTPVQMGDLMEGLATDADTSLKIDTTFGEDAGENNGDGNGDSSTTI